jgi:hypothetical protein
MHEELKGLEELLVGNNTDLLDCLSKCPVVEVNENYTWDILK